MESVQDGSLQWIKRKAAARAPMPCISETFSFPICFFNWQSTLQCLCFHLASCEGQREEEEEKKWVLQWLLLSLVASWFCLWRKVTITGFHDIKLDLGMFKIIGKCISHWLLQEQLAQFCKQMAWCILNYHLCRGAYFKDGSVISWYLCQNCSSPNQDILYPSSYPGK